MSAMANLFFAFSGLLVAIVAVFIAFRKLRSAGRRILSDSSGATLRADGALDVGIVAAFIVQKGIPFLAQASSSLGQRLVLHAREVEYGLVRKNLRPYGDIESVDTFVAPGTANVVLYFRGKRTGFAGNAGNVATAAEALAWLHAKGCPLTPRALALLDRAPPPPDRR